jgi:uncharacterized protein (DUF1330 family)
MISERKASTVIDSRTHVYLVAIIEIEDPENYQAYGKAWKSKIGAAPSPQEIFVERYGGETIVISDAPEVLEGEWKGRLVVLKFPDNETARAWYDSPEYRAIRGLRMAYSTTAMSIHPAFDPAAALGQGPAPM